MQSASYVVGLGLIVSVSACSSGGSNSPNDTGATTTAADTSQTDTTTSADGGSCGGGSASAGDVTITVSGTLQTMDGFGAADVWMGALTSAQNTLFFDPVNGIGLSILRIGIDPTGAKMGSDNWANAKAAQSFGAIVWAAPWSPPAADKSNASLDDGGTLETADQTAWATTLAGFAATATTNGVTLYGISAQNEPDFVAASYDSCVYTGAQMVAFVDVLGPMLHALTPSVKMIAAEPDVWSDLWGGSNNYGGMIVADATANTQVDVLATHQYGNGAVTAIPAGTTPTQHLWETEASGVQGSTEAGPSSDIANGIAVANWIHDAIVTGGASAWHYWWLQSLNADNEGLLLQAGATTGTDGGVITKRLYTMGNFSKFVRPGATRVTLTGAPSGVNITAYTNTTGNVVIVAINTNTSATAASFFVGGGTGCTATPYETSATNNLAALPAIAVAQSRFTATLSAQSVTTFVVL